MSDTIVVDTTTVQKVFTPEHSGEEVQRWPVVKILQGYGSSINDSPKYQRPDVFGFPKFGSGSSWQRKLIGALLKGKNIQPFHYRLTYNDAGVLVWEVVDGGHRTRTIYHFLTNSIKTPIDCTLVSDDGTTYNIGGMHLSAILSKFPELESYIYNQLHVTVIAYSNISDDDAENLFLTLNDLNKMSAADKRNAINNIIADIVRSLGASNSPNAYPMFTSTKLNKKGELSAEYTDLSPDSRDSDEIVAWTLYNIWNGGILSANFPYQGYDAQVNLDEMYRDTALIRELNSENSTLLANTKACLAIMNKIVTNYPRMAGFPKGKNWGAGQLKKLMMLVCETARIKGIINFARLKLDERKFFSQLDKAHQNLKKGKTIRHNKHRRYHLVDNVVMPLPDDQQPKLDKIGDTDYTFNDVFNRGARLDDLQYIYWLFVSEGYLTYGKKIVETRRDFTTQEVERLLDEQNNRCRMCAKEIGRAPNDMAIDHILPISEGGPNSYENTQALCTDCNARKAHGMTFDDLVYLCERVRLDDTLKTAIINIARVNSHDRLSRDNIELAARLIFPK